MVLKKYFIIFFLHIPFIASMKKPLLKPGAPIAMDEADQLLAQARKVFPRRVEWITGVSEAHDTSFDGKIFAYVDGDSINLVDPITKQSIGTIPVAGLEVAHLRFMSDNKTIVFRTSHGNLYHASLQNPKPILLGTGDLFATGPNNQLHILREFNTHPKSFAISICTIPDSGSLSIKEERRLKIEHVQTADVFLWLSEAWDKYVCCGMGEPCDIPRQLEVDRKTGEIALILRSKSYYTHRSLHCNPYTDAPQWLKYDADRLSVLTAHGSKPVHTGNSQYKVMRAVDDSYLDHLRSGISRDHLVLLSIAIEAAKIRGKIRLTNIEGDHDFGQVLAHPHWYALLAPYIDSTAEKK